jgi:hypothetical protein
MEPTTCTLEDGPCPGAACAMWDAERDACALDRIRTELNGLPDLASHLLELRAALDPFVPAAAARTRFFHRLNLENVHDGGAR